eukprot:UN09764
MYERLYSFLTKHNIIYDILVWIPCHALNQPCPYRYSRTDKKIT